MATNQMDTNMVNMLPIDSTSNAFMNLSFATNLEAPPDNKHSRQLHSQVVKEGWVFKRGLSFVWGFFV